MNEGDLFAEKYVIDHLLEAPGPRDVYAVHFGEETARLDVPVFEVREIAVESEHLITILEQTDAFIVTELDDGPPADDLSLEEVVAIMSPISAALSALHAEGVVHGALSVAAIARVGDAFKLRDAGLGGWLADGAFADAEPEWFEHVAPEQLAIGPQTIASDIWAFGTLTFRLLTGHPYFPDGSVNDRVRRLLIDPIPPATARGAELGVQVPPELDDFYRRCLARDRADRFETIDEANAALSRTFHRERILERPDNHVRELESARADSGPQAIARPDPEPPPRSRALLIVAVIVALATLAYLFTR